jgi:transcriptional regulator with XRE-family HTH domain
MASKIMLRDRKPFAQWLRQELARNRLKVRELEEGIGAAHGMASHWLNARRSPSPRYLQKIADFFGHDQDHLLVLAGYREADEDVSDVMDPRTHIIAKVRTIDWDDRSYRYIDGFLDSLLSEGRDHSAGAAHAPMMKRQTATSGRALVSSPN